MAENNTPTTCNKGLKSASSEENINQRVQSHSSSTVSSKLQHRGSVFCVLLKFAALLPQEKQLCQLLKLKLYVL